MLVVGGVRCVHECRCQWARARHRQWPCLTPALPGALQHVFLDVLDPQGRLRVAWDAVSVFPLLYAILITPYMVGFNIAVRASSLAQPLLLERGT